MADMSECILPRRKIVCEYFLLHNSFVVPSFTAIIKSAVELLFR